jgi:hypothetical protein
VSSRSEDEQWHLRKSGVRFWGSGVPELVLDADERPVGYCKLVRDRTDARTQMEALRSALHAERARVDATMSQLAMLCHELRSTVAPVVNATNVLELVAMRRELPGRKEP